MDDYKNKINRCKLLGAEKFQKVVFKVESLKYKTIKFVCPNFLNYYDKFLDYKRRKEIKKVHSSANKKMINEKYRRHKMLVHKEFNCEKNINYHMDINHPSGFIYYLNWNKNVHKRGLVKNAFLISCFGMLSFFEVPFAPLLMMLEIGGAIINFQCINIQNYNITNPQEIYEGNYNNLKLELEKNTIKKVEPIIEKVPEVRGVEEVPKVKIEKIEKVPEIKVNIIKAKDIINNDTLNINLDTVEDKTLKIKKENMEKNLISNTISLNDLIKQDDEIKETSKVIDTINDESYSLNDYKKIVEMLKEIKNNSNKNNISIDDAVTMSLINNYSIDDCVKFKEILESNLN